MCGVCGWPVVYIYVSSSVVSLTSETSGSFTNKASKLPAHMSSDRDQGGESQGGSHVFCRGDYDFPLNTPPDHFLSVKQRDYPKNGSHLPKEKGYSHVLPRLERLERIMLI